MPKIKNLLTGFEGEASQADVTNNVYNQVDSAGKQIWQISPDVSTPVSVSTGNLNDTMTSTTTIPNTIDSSSGSKYAQNTADEIKRLEQEQIDYDKIQKEDLERQIADIQREYTQREEEAKKSFNEQEGSAGVVQFRLGQSGTPYQQAEQAKTAKAKLDFFNNLTAEKNSQISALKSAYAANNFKAVSAIRDNIYNLKQQQENFLQQERAAKLKEAQDAIKAAREEKVFNQEQEDRYIKNLIPQIYGNLTGDSPTDLQTINDFSEQYGIDKNMIMGNLISYKTAQDKETLLNSSNVANLLSKSVKGGKINVPGLGDIEILGASEDKAPTTLKASGKIYNWTGGKWTDTGISDSDFTPSNIIDALSKLENSDALTNYLQSVGIDTGTNGQGMRTDRHNNPTAMTTDVAKNGGLIEGVDYVKGDPFQTAEGKTLYTAKLLGDPIETTIKAIDKMGFTTQSGKQRWSYTQNIPGANNKEWPKLSQEQKANVIQQMYKNEGGSGSLFGENEKFDKFSQEQIALSVMPVQTRNSEKELERALQGIRTGLAQGLSPYEIADNLMGYKVNKKDAFSDTIRGYISQSEKLDGTAPSEFARMINAGNKTGVVTKLENAILKGTEGKNKETLAIYTNNYGNKAITQINDVIGKLGILEGNWNKIAKKVRKDEDFQKLSSTLAALVSDWRHEMIGAAATENELKMIDDLIPKVTDNPFNAIQKIKELQYMTLTSANSIRESENLPSLTSSTLINRDKRVDLYGGGAKEVKTVNGVQYEKRDDGKWYKK